MIKWLGSLVPKRQADKHISKRNYYGAQNGRFFSFGSLMGSADSALRTSLPTLRGRSRDLAINNPHVSRYLECLCTNVVGPEGFRLQADIRNAPTKRNKSGPKDYRANEIIEGAWREWCRHGMPTTSGKASFIDCQNLLIKGLARDGEVFIHLVKNSKYPHGFKIEFIEPELIDETKNQNGTGKTKIVMGIEMTDYNKPVAYHVREDTDTSYYRAQRHRRIPADEMLHIFIPNRPSQSRGEPWTAPVMHRLKMLDAFDEAQIVAARMAANVSYAVTSTDVGVGIDDFVDDQPITFGEPGNILRLNPGEDVKTLAATHPTQSAEAMRVGLIQAISAGFHAPYASISHDLSDVNYSSTQFGASESRDYFASLQRFVIEAFCIPIFDQWLSMSLTTNSIELPLSKYQKYATGVQFFPRTWHHNDPQKEIKAMAAGLESGVLTISDIAKKNGRTVDEHMDELMKTKEAGDAVGIDLFNGSVPQIEKVEEDET